MVSSLFRQRNYVVLGDGAFTASGANTFISAGLNHCLPLARFQLVDDEHSDFSRPSADFRFFGVLPISVVNSGPVLLWLHFSIRSAVLRLGLFRVLLVPVLVVGSKPFFVGRIILGIRHRLLLSQTPPLGDP